MLNKGKNIMLNIFSIMIIVFLCISIFSNFQTVFLGKKFNQLFGYTMFEIKTASMTPKIKIGDWILVKITNDVKLNDIVTYEDNGSFVTHRLIESYNNTYVTKGDSNNTKDEPITNNQIVGTVVKIMPKFGILKKTLFNPWVLISLFITVMLYCLLFDNNQNKKTEEQFLIKIKSFFKKYKKKKDSSAITEENIKYVKEHFKEDNNTSSETRFLSKVKIDSDKKKIYKLLENNEDSKEKRKVESKLDDLFNNLR